MAVPPRNSPPPAEDAEIYDAELVDSSWGENVQSPFANSSQRSAIAAARLYQPRQPAPSKPKIFAPRRPTLLRAGVFVFVFGYLMALAAVIFMAHGSPSFKEDAEKVHGIAKVVMLFGAVIVLLGYRK